MGTSEGSVRKLLDSVITLKNSHTSDEYVPQLCVLSCLLCVIIGEQARTSVKVSQVWSLILEYLEKYLQHPPPVIYQT